MQEMLAEQKKIKASKDWKVQLLCFSCAITPLISQSTPTLGLFTTTSVTTFLILKFIGQALHDIFLDHPKARHLEISRLLMSKDKKKGWSQP